MAEISNQLSVNSQGINPSSLANARRANEETEETNRTAENDPARNRAEAAGEDAASSSSRQDRVNLASSERTTEAPGAVEERVLRDEGGPAVTSSRGSQLSQSPSAESAASTQPDILEQTGETSASGLRSINDTIRNEARGSAPSLDTANESDVEFDPTADNRPDRSVDALIEDARGESGSGLIAGVNINPAFETPSQRLDPPPSTAVEGNDIKPARPNPEDENLRDSVETQIENRELREEQETARRESVEEQNDRGQNINRLI